MDPPRLRHNAAVSPRRRLTTSSWCDTIGRMLRLSVGISILLVTACTHNRAVVQPDGGAAAKASGTAARSQVAVPVAAVLAAAPSTGGGAPKSAVNTDLLKQGYRTGMRHGQLVYCRTEQLTGSRFKSDVCLSEGQVLDEQKRARDTMTAPHRTQCLGPECNN
jgi:hypothetical protein